MIAKLKLWYLIKTGAICPKHHQPTYIDDLGYGTLRCSVTDQPVRHEHV
jgi:hypothetical protein